MNVKWSNFILALLITLIFYELFTNGLSFIFIIIGLTSIVIKRRFPRNNQTTFLLIAVLSFSAALFTSRLLVLLLGILFLLFISNHLKIFSLIREVLLGQTTKKRTNDFIMVTFDRGKVPPAKIVRNKWLGNDKESVDSIYRWEDINFTKLIGNTVFDLGNTILPKGQNIILIQKVVGNTKILIPEGIAISLDISLLTGKIRIKGEEYTLLNENFKWLSDNYQLSSRKVKVTANVLLGELEVIFL